MKKPTLKSIIGMVCGEADVRIETLLNNRNDYYVEKLVIIDIAQEWGYKRKALSEELNIPISTFYYILYKRDTLTRMLSDYYLNLKTTIINKIKEIE